MDYEKIVTNQNIAYTRCFSKEFADFGTYSVLDNPGQTFYILSNGHIRVTDNIIDIDRCIDVIERYFNKVNKASQISILKSNTLASRCLLDRGYKIQSDWEDMYYVFDANFISQIPLRPLSYNIIKITSKKDFDEVLSTYKFPDLQESWLNRLAGAYDTNLFPYIHYLAVYEKQVIGISSLAILDKVGYMISASVSEGHRREGVYNNMVIERAKEALNNNANYLILNTARSNVQTNSNAEKFGYIERFSRNFYVKNF